MEYRPTKRQLAAYDAQDRVEARPSAFLKSILSVKAEEEPCIWMAPLDLAPCDGSSYDIRTCECSGDELWECDCPNCPAKKENQWPQS